MPQRVVIFLDGQNVYRGARRAFFAEGSPHFYGNVNPRTLAELIVARPRPDGERVLSEVRIYTGRPDSTRQPKRYAPHMRQSAQWSAWAATVIHRPLRYPYNWPDEREQEKGIDVALAIDFVSMAIDDQYDVGILMSTDTDLLPALEYVAHKFNPRKTVEVGAWHSDQAKNRLRVRGLSVWCHLLTLDDYNATLDHTDYR